MDAYILNKVYPNLKLHLLKCLKFLKRVQGGPYGLSVGPVFQTN
jgi:hypothetical protein